MTDYIPWDQLANVMVVAAAIGGGWTIGIYQHVKNSGRLSHMLMGALLSFVVVGFLCYIFIAANLMWIGGENPFDVPVDIPRDFALLIVGSVIVWEHITDGIIAAMRSLAGKLISTAENNGV